MCTNKTHVMNGPVSHLLYAVTATNKTAFLRFPMRISPRTGMKPDAVRLVKVAYRGWPKWTIKKNLQVSDNSTSVCGTLHAMTSRWSTSSPPSGANYDDRFEQLAQTGHDVHGEAAFLMSFGPTTVLDAGCGTGRVAIELARRGVEVVGVDLDRSMLERAVDKEPELEWYLADLVNLQLVDGEGFLRSFDIVVAAGNVMILCADGTESRIVSSLARHLPWGGRLIAGFQLQPGRYDLDRYDQDCLAAGLVLEARYSTWSFDPFRHQDRYAVSVHQRPEPPAMVTGATADTERRGQRIEGVNLVSDPPPTSVGWPRSTDPDTEDVSPPPPPGSPGEASSTARQVNGHHILRAPRPD